MRSILPLAWPVTMAAIAAVGPGISCNDGYGVLLAKQVENRGELVGGPVAMADVGDYLLQNDLIKVNILGVKDSPGPGIFGGSIVDIDVRRDRLGFENATGHDRFAELFPVANLLVPFPKDITDVKVLNTGKDGKEASIRVEGAGSFLFEALSILRDKADLLKLLFPDIKTSFRFRTDYILRPGDRHITINTKVILDEDVTPVDGCVDVSTCPVCLDGYDADPVTGCLLCTCSQPQQLPTYSQAESVFGQIFGELQNASPPPKYRAGMVAGDFVFFGNQTDVFAPGIGFDTDKAIHDAFYEGRNTFQQPLSFDFVSAAGGDVSYGYFTVPPPGSNAVVNVPIFTSAATAFLAAGRSCLFDTSDDAECDTKRVFQYERYLAVGDGDVASVSDEVWKTRKTPVGHIKGVVQSLATGEPSPKAHLYVFKDPAPGRAWGDIDELARESSRIAGSYGIVDQIDADVGLDLVLDGDFHATLPPDSYVLVARTEDGMGFSRPISFKLAADETQTLVPEVVTPGTVEYRVTDEGGNLMPAKVALVSLDAKGNPLETDGLRRVYLGDSRIGNGIRVLDYSADGTGTVRVEPGRYRFRASRGPEYGIFEKDVQVDAARAVRVDATVAHEVDTTGWMSADMHLHSAPSFDSGMPLPKRLTTIVDEHVEFAVPTDHDVETDYGPTIRALFLDPYVATAVGAETTTIEQGHFIAFPLKYDADVVPTHGSYDPTCREGGTIVEALQSRGADPSYKPFTILAHPRDGFFGYMYQLGVDPFTMKRTLGTLEANNPVFETATCAFDGMELINGKRFDLVRTATVEEVVDWNRCRARVDAAKTQDALVGVCPEITAGMLAPCPPNEQPFTACQGRNRTALAWESTKRILKRTPEEQEAYWNFPKTSADGEPLCSISTYGDKPVPRETAELPCTFYSGHVDDYMRYLEHGMRKTHIASSDSHDGVHEPGYPRTYFQIGTDAPSSLTTKDMVDSLKHGHALTSYGAYVTGKIGDKTFGDVAPATAGGKVTLDLSVQTASWFGVDRIEIYVNGHIVKVIEPKSKPEDIVDFSGPVVLDVPKRPDTAIGKDSWIVVIAMGLEDRNLMRPVTLDIPYGEIQISKVTSDAFALIPVVNGFFTPVPTLPDWFPIPAYAVSNPIYLDTDGNGDYDAPLPFPEFCSQPCDPNAAATCPSDQQCLEVQLQCGVALTNTCTHRVPWAGGSDALDAAAAKDAGK
jgi:hypothetical protein